MTSYEILRYPTISFWNILDAVLWNIRGIAFVNLGQFDPQDKVCCVGHTYIIIYIYICLHIFIYILI